MHESAAFARHRIFVPAAEIEGAPSRFGTERPVDCHEGVIAIDDNPGPVGPTERRQVVDAAANPAAPEHHVADKDQIVVAASRSFEEAIRESIEGLDRDAFDGGGAGFFPARELAPRAVELA